MEDPGLDHHDITTISLEADTLGQADGHGPRIDDVDLIAGVGMLWDVEGSLRITDTPLHEGRERQIVQWKVTSVERRTGEWRGHV
jgi:hypothetical protein